MPDRSLKLRALLVFYSSANIAGCVLALAGPALLFTGVIGPGWLPITAGLYAAGWLLGRRAPALERQIEDSLSIGETLSRLDAVIAGAKPYLTAEMSASLAGVRTSVAEVLPRLLGNVAGGATGANGGGRTHDGDLYTVRETVLRYLPETLANYAALPPAFRGSHVLKDGKTARQLLAGQLALLEGKLREIVANVAASDAQALLANGNFLEAKFRQPDFLAR